MNRIRVVLIYFLCIMLLCGCRRDSIVIETPDGNASVNLYIDFAEKAFDEKDYYTALNNYLKVEELYTDLSYSDGDERSSLYYMIGRCYMRFSDYRKAKSYFEKSLEISEKKSDNELSYSNYKYLMNIEFSIGGVNLEKALEYGEKAEKLAFHLYGGQSAEVVDVYSDIGKVYCGKEEFDIAEKYLKKALKIVDKLYGANNEKGAKIYKELAVIYIKQV